MKKSFCNKLFICFLFMLLVVGCGKKELQDENLVEKEIDEAADENFAEEETEEITEEVMISEDSMETEDNMPEEEETDRGKESPLAVYAEEQLGKEISYCHEADYDLDGEKEVFFSVEIERTDEKEPDKLEIYFVDDDYEITLVDTQESGLPEDQEDRDERVWDAWGPSLGEYDERPAFVQLFVWVWSADGGHHKEILYGCIEEEPVKLKEVEGTIALRFGIWLRTTYLYDGSISDVTDKKFLKICAGDFSGVVGGEGNLTKVLEEWYADDITPYEFQRSYECDVDHDGINELYIVGALDSSAVFHKGKEGIECWIYDSDLYLLEDGSFLHVWNDREKIGSSWIYCDRSAVICFDSNGNWEIIDEYARVCIDKKITDWENSAIIKEFSIESSAVEGGYLYFKNGNPITEDEYFADFSAFCIG